MNDNGYVNEKNNIFNSIKNYQNFYSKYITDNKDYNKIPLICHKNMIKKNLQIKINDNGLDLLCRLLTYDPQQRITAIEALSHDYFKEYPKPSPNIYTYVCKDIKYNDNEQPLVQSYHMTIPLSFQKDIYKNIPFPKKVLKPFT